jgi:hypothetical protein
MMHRPNKALQPTTTSGAPAISTARTPIDTYFGVVHPLVVAELVVRPYMRHYVLLLSVALFLTACGDKRPDESEAKRHFATLYPEAKIIAVKMTEDEVVARSYEFRYSKGSINKEGMIEIQFMETGPHGAWGPIPVPPASLP